LIPPKTHRLSRVDRDAAMIADLEREVAAFLAEVDATTARPGLLVRQAEAA
jgi:hypothetical protein